MACAMAGVSRCGKTSPFTKGIGRTTKQTAEVDLSIPMVTYIKVNGKTIRLTVEAFTITTMDPATLANGLKISNRAMEYKNGMTAHLTRGNLFLI
jgi:hypothetical protein